MVSHGCMAINDFNERLFVKRGINPYSIILIINKYDKVIFEAICNLMGIKNSTPNIAEFEKFDSHNQYFGEAHTSMVHSSSFFIFKYNRDHI